MEREESKERAKPISNGDVNMEMNAILDKCKDSLGLSHKDQDSVGQSRKHEVRVDYRVSGFCKLSLRLINIVLLVLSTLL